MERVTAQKISYHGLSKGPLGGWNYSVKELGALQMPNGIGPDEAERMVRKRFPAANRFRIEHLIEPTDRWEWWFSGTI